MSTLADKFSTVESVREGPKNVGYIATKQIARTVYLAYYLGEPILVEGPAGLGKTELAKASAAVYCPRNSQSSDYYRCVGGHFETFLQVY